MIPNPIFYNDTTITISLIVCCLVVLAAVGENEVTIFSYIDNVLEHHFETFQDDISELYKKSFDNDYLIPKK